MACITKRRGRYVIDCYDQNGKRYRKTLPLGITKKKARERLVELEKKISRHTFMHEKQTPLFSEVATDWLKWKEPNIRESTYEWLEGATKNHFTDLDKVKISHITTADVEKWATELQKIGLKQPTIKHMMKIFSQIMGYAVRHRLVDSNPVSDAVKPRRRPEDEKKPATILTPEQIRALLNAVSDNQYHALLSTAIKTGCRKGELLGLKWKDVDFEKSKIHICRTYNHQRIFAPKTQGSIRAIDCPAALMVELRKYKIRSGGREESFVFSNSEGNPLSEAAVYTRLKRTVKSIGGPETIKFHDLRHLYASLLIAQGENVLYIQRQLGHSNPTITLNTYGHLMKQDNPEAAERLERALFG